MDEKSRGLYDERVGKSENARQHIAEGLEETVIDSRRNDELNLSVPFPGGAGGTR